MLLACENGTPIEIDGKAYFIKSDIQNLRDIFTDLDVDADLERWLHMARMKVDLQLHDFWERVDAEIYAQGRTKQDVAKCCGFDRKNLIDRRNISTFYLTILCKELNVSADYLLFGSD